MRYHNFDLWIDNGTRGAYPIRATSEVWGEARGVLTLDPQQAEIREPLEKLAARKTDRDDLVSLGTNLYQHLFNEQIETLFQRCYGQALNIDATGVRLRLRIEPPEIAVLPWELLYQPTEGYFLGTLVRCPVVRYLEVLQEIRALQTPLPLRVLVAVPEVADLNADDEKQKLSEAFADLADSVELNFLEGKVTRARISDTLLEQHYHCFHFIGHGTFEDERGFLLLNADEGGIDYADEQEIAGLFRNHDTMKLVVLNSCQGAEVSSTRPLVGMAPQLVKLGIPAVVAMQFAIGDEAAIRFAREFYRCLFRGRNKGRVDFAMSYARGLLESEFTDQPDLAAPVLFMRAPEGVLFDPVTGNPLRDTPFSTEALHTSLAAVHTYEESIGVLEERKQEIDEMGIHEELSKQKKELARLKEKIKFRNYAAASASATVVLMFFLSWVSLFDFFRLDTRIESYTMWFGDLFTKKTFSERIVIVSIYGEIDRSWREKHAALVDKLSIAGAKVIVFDMYFQEPSNFDKQFINAIERAKQEGTDVIVGFRALKAGQPELIEGLRKVVSGVGAVCVGQKMGYARTVPLAIRKNDKLYPSLALAALMADRDETLIDVDPGNRRLSLGTPGSVPRQLPFSEMTLSRRLHKECPIIGKADLVADLILDLTPFDVLNHPSRRYAFEKIINQPEAANLEPFKGAIVLVGVETQAESFEVRLGEKRYGVELHADALNTVLQAVSIRSLGMTGQFVIMLCLGLVGAFISYWMPQSGRSWRISLLVAVLVAYLASTIYVYSQYHVLLNTVYHAGALLLAYWVTGKVERKWFA